MGEVIVDCILGIIAGIGVAIPLLWYIVYPFLYWRWPMPYLEGYSFVEWYRAFWLSIPLRGNPFDKLKESTDVSNA